MKCLRWVFLCSIIVGTEGLHAQDSTMVRVSGDSVLVSFSDVELGAAIQAIGKYLPKPIVTGTLPAGRIAFFETPRPVPLSDLPALLQGLVEAHNLDFTEDANFYRVLPRAAPAPAPVRPAVTAPQEAAAPPVKLFVVRLRHARAADVAATVNQLFGAAGSFSGSSGLSTGTLSDELRRDAPGAAPPQPAAAPETEEPAEATLTGPVTIVPDELTNALLVRSTDLDFAVLSQAIDQLDVRPLQVLIEVLIVEARKDRSFRLGVDVSIPPQPVDDGTIQADLFGLGLGDVVVQVMSLGKYEINASIAAARRRGDVRIISRPVLLASNNTESRLLVGSQRPFVQVSRSLPTDSPSRDQVVQFRDVGTKLTVRPTINQDGYVSLLIQQEISAATEETQFDAPVISTREALTQVLVADGQTVVLGGLTDKQEDRVRTGVPILSDIPIIGALFGSTTTRHTETELFLFITPTILRDDADAQRVTEARLPAKARANGKKPAAPKGNR